MTEHQHPAPAPESVNSPSSILNKNLTAPNFRDEEVRFSFKTRKPAEGSPEALSGAVPEKRPTVTLNVPVLTFEGLVEYLSADSPESIKTKNFILENVNAAIIDAVRSQVNDEDKPVNRQDELDLSKLDLNFLANLPKAERAGGGISKETWEAFEADYVEVMVTATGKEKSKIEKAAKLLVARLNPVKSEKPVLKFLQTQLALWAGNTPNADDFAEVYQFLDNKISTLLNKSSEELLASL